jgi:hypothetical protein
VAGHSSLAQTIRNRVTQFAATFFSSSSNHIPRVTSSSSTASFSTTSAASTAMETSTSNLVPLVFPNLGLGVTSAVVQGQPQLENLPPPSITSVTSRIVEGRLQTERMQPQLRLAAPTPNPTAFHHLPRDAIRLEKF